MSLAASKREFRLNVAAARSCSWVQSVSTKQSPTNFFVQIVLRTKYAGGCDVRLEASFEGTRAPRLRVRQIFYHGHVDELGYPSEAFYTALSWHTSPHTLMHLLTTFKAFIESPPALPTMGLGALRVAWKGHDPNCVCMFSRSLPFSYNRLQSLPLAAQEHQISRVGRELAARQQAAETVSQERRQATLSYRNQAATPALFNGGWRTDWFAPEFWATAQTVEKAKTAGDALEAVRALVHEEVDGVFSFPMLSDAFCGILIAELRAYEASGFPKPRPNSMNNYGLVLNDIGLERLFDELLEHYVRPLASLLFENCGGRTLDHHHTFLVEYREDQDVSLDMHVDDADVTLNVNLLDGFDGSGLCFCGYAMDVDHRKHSLTYSHRRGVGVMHAGSRRHGALPLSKGERVNLIVWCRSAQYRLTEQFGQRRQEALGATEPDMICLSRTHDDDYDEQVKRILSRKNTNESHPAPLKRLRAE